MKLLLLIPASSQLSKFQPSQQHRLSPRLILQASELSWTPFHQGQAIFTFRTLMLSLPAFSACFYCYTLLRTENCQYLTRTTMDIHTLESSQLCLFLPPNEFLYSFSKPDTMALAGPPPKDSHHQTLSHLEPAGGSFRHHYPCSIPPPSSMPTEPGFVCRSNKSQPVPTILSPILEVSLVVKARCDPQKWMLRGVHDESAPGWFGFSNKSAM